MAITFQASVIKLIEEPWGMVVLLSVVDETLEAENYLMTQRKDRVSDQDVRFEMDDVYIETCGQGWSWYGHIKAFELFRNRVSVQLDEAAAARMRDDGLIEVTFECSDDRFSDLKVELRRTFADRCYYVEHVV